MSDERNKLDDAAARALYRLLREQNPRYEHVGVLYEDEDDIKATPTMSSHSQQRTDGRFNVPAGSARGLFHNHPPMSMDRKGRGMIGEGSDIRDEFSTKDIVTAKRLGVPSYIAIDERNSFGGLTPMSMYPDIRRYDPATGKDEEVLHQFPIDVVREALMRKLLNREPDDPRGLYREEE